MAIFSLPHLLDSPRWARMRVGLLGGSFNPPHEGHVHISLAALKGLRLDAVWWLVTPKNPLKDKASLSLEERVRLSKELVKNPKILVSDLEKDLGTSITYYAVKKLRKHYPKTQFAWISGMDNALSLHRWNHWRGLLKEICMVHLTRPPATGLIQGCPLRMQSTQIHRVIDRGAAYPLDSGVTYWMLQKQMIDASSTSIREKESVESMA